MRGRRVGHRRPRPRPAAQPATAPAAAPPLLLAGLRADATSTPAELGRASGPRADRAEALGARLRRASNTSSAAPDLDDDHAEGCRRYVVQLTPDPGLLLGDRPPVAPVLPARGRSRRARQQLTDIGADSHPAARRVPRMSATAGCSSSADQTASQDGPGGDTPPRPAVRRRQRRPPSTAPPAPPTGQATSASPAIADARVAGISPMPSVTTTATASTEPAAAERRRRRLHRARAMPGRPIRGPSPQRTGHGRPGPASAASPR